ncbi:MAG: hypothetical protein MHMPM18_002270 [Marteilia pararefringens]
MPDSLQSEVFINHLNHRIARYFSFSGQLTFTVDRNDYYSLDDKAKDSIDIITECTNNPYTVIEESQIKYFREISTGAKSTTLIDVFLIDYYLRIENPNKANSLLSKISLVDDSVYENEELKLLLKFLTLLLYHTFNVYHKRLENLEICLKLLQGKADICHSISENPNFYFRLFRIYIDVSNSIDQFDKSMQLLEIIMPFSSKLNSRNSILLKIVNEFTRALSFKKFDHLEIKSILDEYHDVSDEYLQADIEISLYHLIIMIEDQLSQDNQLALISEIGRFFDQLLKCQPLPSEIYYWKGFFEFKCMDNIESAIVYLEQAIEINNRNSKAGKLLFSLYKKTQKSVFYIFIFVPN